MEVDGKGGREKGGADGGRRRDERKWSMGSRK
jgi:hypothetical protein